MAARTEKRSFDIGKRITIVALVFTLPISLLFQQVWSSMTEFVSFADKEVAGNAYQKPLEQAFEAVQKTRLALLGNGLDSGSGSVVTTSRNEADKAFESLVRTDAEFGELLQFTDEGLGKRDRTHLRVLTLQKEWAAAEDAIDKGVLDDAHRQIEHVVADLRAYITHAGDTSNLILDPDLDSYYLMDVTLLALPQSQDRIAGITRMAYELSAKPQPTEPELVAAAVQAALLEEADIARIVASTNTSINEDRNCFGVSESLQGTLPAGLKNYQKKATALVALVREIAAKTPVDPERVRVVGGEALAASFAFWNASVGELDTLLNRRIGHFETKRAWIMGLSAVALVISFGLAWKVKQSITAPLTQISNSLGPGATLLAECAGRIADEKNSVDPDERRVIVGELVAHARDMQTVVVALSALVGGSSVTTEQTSDNTAPPQRAATMSGGY